MKSTTTHRSGLSMERMKMFDETNIINSTGTINTNYGTPNTADTAEYTHKSNTGETRVYSQQNSGQDDLDMLYGRRTVTPAHRFQKGSMQKTPAVYLCVGFIAGIFFTLIVAGVISLSTREPKKQSASTVETQQTTVTSDEQSESAPVQDEDSTSGLLPSDSETTYTIKSGDTLNKIVIHFYGKSDTAKVEEIQRVNNISNPSRLQIGQKITIPAQR